MMSKSLYGPDRRGVPEPKVGVTAGLELERGRGAEPGPPDRDVGVAAVARGVRGLVPGPHELVGGFVKVVADCGGSEGGRTKARGSRPTSARGWTRAVARARMKSSLLGKRIPKPI